MENVVNAPHNRGALPRDYAELQLVEELGETNESDVPDEQPIGNESDKQEAPLVYTHVRVPEIRRGGTRILMGITALCGAAAGAVTALSGAAEPEMLETISETLTGTIGEIFLQRAAISAAFLGIELILGFFALGDWIVWLAPLCYAMGTALRVAASGSGILLPSAAAGVAAVTLAAATSATMSKTLMRLSKGGTVYLESSPRRSYALAFFGYAVTTALSAVYEGIALNWK